MYTARFLNVLLAAILTGTSFGIWVGLDPAPFSAEAYLESQKQLVDSLNTLMVTLVVLATITTIWSAYLHRAHRPTMVALLVAALGFIACILITRLGNVPAQELIMAWESGAMPTDWHSARDAWWHYHGLRTIPELIALIIIIWVSVRPLPSRSPA